MTKQIKSFSDLRDSRLLYDKNPPALGLFLVMVVVIAFIAILIWSIYTPKTYIVKSNGTIDSFAQNYIMSAYTGEIIASNVAEGSYVKKGDILFQLSSTELDSQAERIHGLILVSQEKIKQYERLENCIKNGVNFFDENNEKDKTFFYMYETYLSQIGQKEIDLNSYKSYNYTDEQIADAIQSNEAAIAEIYYSNLKGISEQIQNLQTAIEDYELQLSSINSGKKDYPVIAKISGLVHMDTEYKPGMIVQAGVAIGNIVSENDTYYVTAHTASNDRPLIHVGDKVDIAVLGLVQSIYGTVGGTVSYIASDATVNNNDGSSFFLVKIDLNDSYLVSSKGNKVNLSNSMAVEARIVYDEVTYFNYVLESLGFLVR